MNAGMECMPTEALVREFGGADDRRVMAAIAAETPDERDLAVLLSSTAGRFLEDMARRARELTQRHFGRTITLYAPLYLSDHCSGGCVYCGFASDRKRERRMMGAEESEREMRALREMGIDEILLLTGDRTLEADFGFLRDNVKTASGLFDSVTVEAFSMTGSEYRALVEAGCVGVTLYQETYDAAAYQNAHRWGTKKDFHVRLEAPEHALSAGVRMMGMGVLLGLSDPVPDAVALFRHVRRLQRRFWMAGFSVSFPRIRPEMGGYRPAHPVSDRFLAQMIFAFRICLPDAHLALSTRESAAFRDGMAGLGVSKMSVASRTTVGGYSDNAACRNGQFDVYDTRDAPAFCAALRGKGLDPVFKNWDRVYRG